VNLYDEVQKLIWEFNDIRAENGWFPGTKDMKNYVRALWLKEHIDEIRQAGEEFPPGMKERVEEFLRLWRDWVVVNKLIDHYRDLMREADIGRYKFTPEDVEKLKGAIERLKSELPRLNSLVEELEHPVDKILTVVRAKRERGPFIQDNWTLEIECYYGGKADIIPVKVTPFPLERAKGAYSINSWTPEKDAEYDQLSYLRTLNRYAEKVQKLCPLIGPERAKRLIQNFSKRYIELYEDYLTTRARIPSAHVVGPARMPSQDRLEKLWRTEHRKLSALDEFIKNAFKKLDKLAEELKKEQEALKQGAVNKKAVGELERLKEELAILEKRREIMKEANKIIRSKKLTPEEKERKLKEIGAFKVAEAGHFFFWPEPDELGRIGFPDFELRRVGEKIKRLKARIEELEKKEAQAKGTTSGVQVLAKGDGWKIIANHADDRLWVVFTSAPPAEVRRELKAHGFRWSPKRKAWVRKLTDNAIADALEIIERTMNVPGLSKKFGEVRLNPPELKEPWNEVWKNARKALYDGVYEVVLHETGKPPLDWKAVKEWNSDTQAEKTWLVKTAVGDFELTMRLGQLHGAYITLSARVNGETIELDGVCEVGRGKDPRKYVPCVHSLARELTKEVLERLSPEEVDWREELMKIIDEKLNKSPTVFSIWDTLPGLVSRLAKMGAEVSADEICEFIERKKLGWCLSGGKLILLRTDYDKLCRDSRSPYDCLKKLRELMALTAMAWKLYNAGKVEPVKAVLIPLDMACADIKCGKIPRWHGANPLDREILYLAQYLSNFTWKDANMPDFCKYVGYLTSGLGVKSKAGTEAEKRLALEEEARKLIKEYEELRKNLPEKLPWKLSTTTKNSLKVKVRVLGRMIGNPRVSDEELKEQMEDVRETLNRVKAELEALAKQSESYEPNYNVRYVTPELTKQVEEFAKTAPRDVFARHLEREFGVREEFLYPEKHYPNGVCHISDNARGYYNVVRRELKPGHLNFVKANYLQELVTTYFERFLAPQVEKCKKKVEKPREVPGTAKSAQPEPKPAREEKPKPSIERAQLGFYLGLKPTPERVAKTLVLLGAISPSEVEDYDWQKLDYYPFRTVYDMLVHYARTLPTNKEEALLARAGAEVMRWKLKPTETEERAELLRQVDDYIRDALEHPEQYGATSAEEVVEQLANDEEFARRLGMTPEEWARHVRELAKEYLPPAPEELPKLEAELKEEKRKAEIPEESMVRTIAGEKEGAPLEEVEVPVKVHGEATELPLEEVAEMATQEEEDLRFIRRKLTDTWEGYFELHDVRPPEPPLELIERLAREVYEGRLTQPRAMAIVMKEARKALPKAKVEEAKKMLGAKPERRAEREVKELTPEEEAISEEIEPRRAPEVPEEVRATYERLLKSLDRRLLKRNIDLDFVLPDIERDLWVLADMVAKGELPFDSAVIEASKLATSVYNQKVGRRELPVEMKKRSGGVVSATEIVERRKELSKPKNIYHYLGEVPEWLSRALEDPRELSAMLWYGVERYLKEKAKTHSDASMYADFLRKWLGEKIVAHAVSELERKDREGTITWREALTLYALQNFGGRLVEGGIDAFYRVGSSWVRAWIINNARAGDVFSEAVQEFLRRHPAVYVTVKPGIGTEVSFTEGETRYPTLMFIMAIAPDIALKLAGYLAEFPEPEGSAYRFVVEKLKEWVMRHG